MHEFHHLKDLESIDPGLFELTKLEDERQARRLIMIPSESSAPKAVRELLGSSFTNIYAEGYPRSETRWQTEEEIFDYTKSLGAYRRYSDPRYYKGVEYVDIVEALARRRCAEAFAANGLTADDLFVNVQPLSGAPANNAVYTAFLSPGDTILGMNLLHGGHLTHGSSVNRSGMLYDAHHYTVDPETERLDYDAILEKALATKPKIIIAGYSSYPWVPDWQKFREIADSVGALLLADVSHIAGLIAADQILSPVGFAHIITFTTHKTLIGPRGACIITDNASYAKKIDKAVFPGEQGGPHNNTIAALALTFKLAQTTDFKELQSQIIKNAIAFADQLKKRGLRVPYDGTDTHIVLLDCKSVKAKDGAYLSGDMGARILDIAGIVANRNTIPGDRSAFSSTGVRFGTTWLTQRGFKEEECRQIADIIADLFEATTPYNMPGRRSPLRRAKVDFNALEQAKLRVKELAQKADQLFPVDTKHGYPHYYDIEDKSEDKWASFKLSGDQIRPFLIYSLSSDVEALSEGESQPTLVHTTRGDVRGVITCQDPFTFTLTVPGKKAGLVSAWLRDLSDAYIKFDQDLLMRVPGPMQIEDAQTLEPVTLDGDPISQKKPYYIGMEKDESHGQALPAFEWAQEPQSKLLKTPLNDTHREMGAKMVPFAGWDMPVWYSSVLEEHRAVRQAAGLFDVTHMGVYQAEGPDAGTFLDSVCANDISGLDKGKSCYTHFLDQDANVIDDLLVYRREKEKFLVVVNASNDKKDWDWLNKVRKGEVRVDNHRPWTVAFGRKVTLRNLRDHAAGDEMRVDIAIQGPRSRDILLKLDCSLADRQAIKGLAWTQLCEVSLDRIDLIVSRTGYTGERMGFELYVHPDKAVELWKTLLKKGEPLGLKPCGLGARDSLRTEAGLPLYGHEMGGTLNLSVGQAGFGNFVKTYKPWFIGRQAFIDQEDKRDGEVVRFTFDEKRTRMAHLGDPIVDDRGKVIGTVTSCAINAEGSLTGQAYVGKKYTKEGTTLYIYQGAPEKVGKPPADLTKGDRVTLPARATVITRFPK
ncbi:MAG: glycine cleavage system aminomethyltransferase GcvT [Chloroflexota bacterium]|nr:glycine cleavage system aminomethyltransferase GcvT [Chloroflexota bacterium]